jgi:hypothetical protein
VFVFTAMSFTSKNYSKDKQDSIVTVEKAKDPEACWAAADAAEVYSCGSEGCDYGLWSAVYSACMGFN